jgi:Domain of unknown function (DUF1330)
MATNTAGQFAISQTPPAQAGSPHGPAAGAGDCAPPLIRGAESPFSIYVEPHSGQTSARAAALLAVIEKYGGRYLVRGGASEVFEGDWQPNRLILPEFPDTAVVMLSWRCCK